MKRLIDLYPYSRIDGKVRFLILKRADGVPYSGQWRMIGGKVKPDEKAWEAAQRELLEETGLSPLLFWSVPTVNHFYEIDSDSVKLIPAFAAEINPERSISLNHEHSSHIWISVDEIADYIKWPEQKRIIKIIFEKVTQNEILEDWII